MSSKPPASGLIIIAVALVGLTAFCCVPIGVPALIIAALTDRHQACTTVGAPKLEDIVDDFDDVELPPILAPFDTDQLAHAVTVVRTGISMNIPPRGYIVALATVSQESTFRNLANSTVPESMAIPHEGVGGDHDSVGIFQQRPSMGWGSVRDLMTPQYAARKFYEALNRVSGWQGMAVTVAADEVQRSGNPSGYADDEPIATAMLALITDNPKLADAASARLDPDTSGCSESTVNGPITRSEVLRRAQYWVDQRITYTQTGPWADDGGGKTYRRDCSGLTSMAWHINNSETTYSFPGSGTMIYLASLHELKPGDGILTDGHMEIFSHWKNERDHTQGAYVYSFNTTGETVQNPYDTSNFGNTGFNSWSNMLGFRAIRYKNIVEDGVVPAAA